ncbi:MAG: DGQHR domain-containing protein [Magnetococcales bacterium]|nr:DGQHR domain-containing protein [Magnetococcales bacterium]MBF0115778.1 DGQHR domain-containing protein [Magnetococcales bacterium]
MENICFKAVQANQSNKHKVLTFVALADEILKIAVIDRITRDGTGRIRGFQRPQISSHIQEIQDYLDKDDAALPNPIVIAFTDKVRVLTDETGISILEVCVDHGPPGLVVDGQQRLMALSRISNKNFQVFVSALICQDENELHKQFILINSTKPLPKSLIYELLPTVSGLPDRLSSRSLAAKLTERLNHDPLSSMHEKIKQHTSPNGVIADTSVQRMIMNSLSDGVCRELIGFDDSEERCFTVVSNFFSAVAQLFPEAWERQTPKTSRLVHGAGIVAMGYVMEFLYARDQETSVSTFSNGLAPLVGHTAWTNGEWKFSENETRPWNGIQNLHRDIQMLASYLTRILKIFEKRKIVSPIL